MEKDKAVLGGFPRRKWLYWREEGMDWDPGLGVMWDHKSRGFLLVIGKLYLWCRYSMRVNRWFVDAGIRRTKEIFREPHPDFNEKGELK